MWGEAVGVRGLDPAQDPVPVLDLEATDLILAVQGHPEDHEIGTLQEAGIVKRKCIFMYCLD